MAKVRKYAQIVNAQINPNTAKRENWKNIQNAVGGNEKYATSCYSQKSSTVKDSKGKKKTVYTHNFPYTITAHRFGITDEDIPSTAKITGITVGVRMKSAKLDSSLVFPQVGFMIRDSKIGITEYPKKQTGWYSGVYWATTDRTLTNKWYRTAMYEMDEATFKKGNYKVSDLKKDLFGVDLYFGASESFTQDVYLMYVWVEVYYDIPVYVLHTNMTGTKNKPHTLNSGKQFTFKYTLHQSTRGVKDKEQSLKIDIPWGTELVSYSKKESSTNIHSTVTPHSSTDLKSSTQIDWKVRFEDRGNVMLELNLIDYTVNTQMIGLTNVTNPKPFKDSTVRDDQFYYYTQRSISDGYDQTRINLRTPYHKRHLGCFDIDSRVQSDDTSVIYRISNDNPFTFENITLNSELTSAGVTMGEPTVTNEYVQVEFTVPSDTEVDIGFKFCMYPHTQGKNTLTVNDLDNPSRITSQDYTVLPPYSYHIGSTENEDETNLEYHTRLVTERISFRNHRIASQLDTSAFVLPCHIKDTDALMTQLSPSIHMYKWERVNYIGCVPLEHLHFDPKSTYKDKLLDSHYKNKRYMGKELAPDEDITLNVRVHPQQVTTLQGLIDMDKPIPINANYLCFEGDALNHRGWAEIFSIKAEETNPSWYKCDIDVKYLTHNLNTRFKIFKGGKTFGKYTIPNLLAEVNASGEKLSSGNQEEDFFVVDTDGTYAYVNDESEWQDYLDYYGDPVKWIGDATEMTVEGEDGTVITLLGKNPNTNETEILDFLLETGEVVKDFELNKNIQVHEDYTVDDNLKNRFTLDEGQHISIKSRQPLSSVNQIEIRWGSSKLKEHKENAISRITRLIDVDTSDVVFEYEYCDFDFGEAEPYIDPVTDEVESILQCRVIGRLKDEADYETVIDDIIDLQSDVETSNESFIDNETQEVLQTDLKYFGDSLIFELNNSHLKIIDEGFNGKEIEREVDLEGKQYYWETYWVNKNTDGEDNDVIAYFDVIVQDTVLTSNFSNMYSSMYISPFPVSDKEILFTRKGEEGIIYYLKDNREEFSYLIEPYYQYHNGVDLRNDSHASIFNLNYGYKVVYLENGLVSLGINRLTGRMHIGRYDPTAKEYISLFDFNLKKYDDVNINSISDDRIELQASDTTIIMYRGHPYVIFKHELEDIEITTKSYKVYGESVDGQTSQFPLYFDLMNKDNLLPECVTKKLDDDCVNIVEKPIEDLTSVELVLSVQPTEDVFEEDTVTYTVTGQPSGSKVCFLVKHNTDNGYDEIGCTTTGSFPYEVTQSGAYQMIAVYVGDDTHEYAISNEVVVKVGKSTVTEPPTPSPSPTPPLVGDYKLTMSCPDTLHYRNDQKILFTLTKGGKAVPNKTIEMIDFMAQNSATTDKNGQCYIINNRVSSHPKTYTIGAKFFDTGSSKPTKSVFKKVVQKKGFAQFRVLEEDVPLFKGRYFTVKLQNNKGYPIPNEKVQVSINGRKYDKKTNSKGNINILMNELGKMKFIYTFNGNKDYYDCKLTYRQTVHNVPLPNVGGK